MRERNEESCETHGDVPGIASIVEPVVVPVPRAVVVAVEVQEIPIAVRVPQECIESHQYHCPSNALRAVSYSAS